MTDITLSQSQLEAADEIRKILEEPATGEHSPLVAIVGLSGVGKDTLWNEIGSEFSGIEFKEFRSLSGYVDIGLGKIEETPGDTYFVTTATPHETTLTHIDKWKGEVKFVKVKGMTEEETRDYITQKAPENTDIEKLVQNSLGVPLLVDMILSRNLNDKETLLLTGTHLNWSLGHEAEKYKSNPSDLMEYLQIRPDRNINRSFFDTRIVIYGPDVVEDDFFLFLNNHKKLKSQGIELKSPLFQAKNSYRIYKTQDNREYGSLVRIFAPNITQENYEIIRNELLPEGETEHADESAFSGRSRLDMFNATWRKVPIYLKPEDEASDTVNVPAEHDRLNSSGYQSFLGEFEGDLKAKLMLPSSFLKDEKGKFLMAAHDHYGTPNLKVGWAVESLLQNLGIPYVVSYGDPSQAYLFNPEKKLMEPVEKK